LLHKQEFVEAWQHPTDGRSTTYAITKAGRKRARKILQLASRYNHRRLAVLTAEEVAAIDRALEKLLKRAAEVNNL
jgi:DNA-binding MarR family transcriptional regulator